MNENDNGNGVQPVTSLMAETTVSPKADDASAPKSKPKSGKKKTGQSRRKSRELVLKALYRGMLNKTDLTPVFKDMLDDPDYRKADEVYFKELLRNVSDKLSEVDEQISAFVDRPVAELSPIEHSILRLSGYELIFDMSIPYRVVINEGVELGKIFGGVDGHKYINGVLDKLAASVRAAEVKA